MHTLTHPARAMHGHGARSLLAELHRRQPQLAATARLFLVATLPLLLALLIDSRTVNDINVWIKPIKFLVSLSLYYATLAWFCAYLPEQVLRSRAGRFIVYVPIAVGVLEMSWLILAAAHGVPSHFNPNGLWSLAYRAAGIGAAILMLAVLVQGILVARHRHAAIAAPLRLAVVLSAVIAFVTTMAFAGYMGRNYSHWIGGIASDAAGLPLFGWSRTGGDLRVAHFWGLHASQLLPLAAWLLVSAKVRAARFAVWMLALAYTAFVVFTFAQALRGEAFLPQLFPG